MFETYAPSAKFLNEHYDNTSTTHFRRYCQGICAEMLGTYYHSVVPLLLAGIFWLSAFHFLIFILGCVPQLTVVPSQTQKPAIKAEGAGSRTIDYLMTFRKCSSLDSLEKGYGKLFDLDRVPKSLWAQAL